MERFQIFYHVSNNEELIKDFDKFFSLYDLEPLFTDEHRAQPIKVTDTDLRSVAITGKYRRDLQEFADLIAMANTNKMYQSTMFRVLYKATTFQKLMSNIRKINEYLTREVGVSYLHNSWNIVWYNEQLY